MVAVAVLIAGTGGENSPFEFLYVPVLAHAAVACGRSWVFVAGGLMTVSSAAPLLLDRTGAPVAGVLGDVADVVVWTAAAVFITVMRDRLRRNEERYRSLFEMHPDPVSSRDRWGRIEQMNPAASSLVGMDPDELAARDWTDFVPPDRLAEIERHFVTALKGRPCSFETQLLHAEGRRIDVAITFIPVVVEGEVIGVHHITQDISERVRAQSERQATQEALRSALDAQEASTERLRAVNEMQKTFLQAVSHELRTPLTSITGYAQTLEGHWGDLPADKVAHILGRLSFNAYRLSDMLQDLLDVDRLSRGTIQLALTRTNLGDLCLRVVDQIEVPDRRVSVRSDVEVVAEVDRPKVERIVENLVYNATKHTPEGTMIVVRIEPRSDGAVISVEDDGPGVPVELRDTIFEPFRQGPRSAAAASPGTGIGLTLVSRFSSLHGGRAWVDETPGGGAAFRVFLPYEPSDDVIDARGDAGGES